MSCDCHLCRDDRKAVAMWKERAAELRREANDYEWRADATLERIDAYPGVAEPRFRIVPGVPGPVTVGRTFPHRAPRGVWSGG